MILHCCRSEMLEAIKSTTIKCYFMQQQHKVNFKLTSICNGFRKPSLTYFYRLMLKVLLSSYRQKSIICEFIRKIFTTSLCIIFVYILQKKRRVSRQKNCFRGKKGREKSSCEIKKSRVRFQVNYLFFKFSLRINIVSTMSTIKLSL